MCAVTLVARKVLADCETAHQLLKKEKMESATVASALGRLSALYGRSGHTPRWMGKQTRSTAM